ANALKRVNVVTPQHKRFLDKTFETVDLEAHPPQDLMHRWAAQATQAPAEIDARRWLGEALDREGHFTDSHPTLRARLLALSGSADALHELPPPVPAESAAQAWLGSLVDRLRTELQARWAEQVAAPWTDRHAEAQKLRQRLAELRALTAPSADQQLETV